MDIEEIADDIFEVIGQYLCWIEKIAFKRTSKKLSAIIKEETIEELIEKRLTYLGIEGKNIIQELKKTNTVISGSFILQCIYNVSWKDSDIDFFSKIPSMENIKEKILSKAADIFEYYQEIDNTYDNIFNKMNKARVDSIVKYCKTTDTGNILEDMNEILGYFYEEENIQGIKLYEQFENHINVKGIFTPSIKSINEYYNSFDENHKDKSGEVICGCFSNKHINDSTINHLNDFSMYHVTNLPLKSQHIICRDNHLRFIRQQFDMNICKIAFDGLKLMIYDIDSIYTRSCIYDRDNYEVMYNYINSDHNCTKRDYDISNKLNHNYTCKLNNIHVHLKENLSSYQIFRSLSRIQKYLSRGFNIIPSEYWKNKMPNFCPSNTAYSIVLNQYLTSTLQNK